jgi:hypothetical protein
MRIGISILTHTGHNVWNSGIGQNVYHLACLLERIPFVERVVLLNCGDQDNPPGDSGDIGRRFPLIALREATDAIDIAVEMSGGLDTEWVARFRARGGKIAFHICGQPYAALIEPPIFKRSGFFSDAERCDEVWLLPKDRPFTAMLRSLYRCPVFELPYLWSPVFLEDTIVRARQDGLQFGYRPGTLASSAAVPAIFEPNVSPIKMGIIPFMICEEIERSDPAALGHVHFLNGKHMAEQLSFVFLVENSELYKAGKLSIGARDYFSFVMARGANVVVSHQLDCPQNYLYLDAIYGGYPLIHNSEFFSDIGYYYPKSDIQAGADMLQLARREHDRNLDTYGARAHRAIEALSPVNPRNRDAYARRLIALSQAARKGRAA